jgi:hypothetical protein
MSKSNNDCLIIYTLLKTICFRVGKRFFANTNILFLVVSYVWSGLIVVLGVYLNVYSRNQAVFNTTITSITNSIFDFRWWPKFSRPTSSRTLPV